MRDYAVIIVVAIALLLTTCGYAQDKPPMDLPVYPGGESTMEVNLTNEDILPMIKAVLPLAGDKLGKLADQVSAEDLGDILKDIKRIEFLQMEVYKAKVGEPDLVDFYTKNLPEGKWNRVYMQSKGAKGTMAIYCQPGFEMLYGFRVRSIKQDSQTIRRVEIIKTEGKIDFIKLISLASKVVKLSGDVKIGKR